MILELRVRGLATVHDVTLSLGPGLNVLTGETGSGKSMLIDALNLLFGARADSSAIRPGNDRATVEAVIDPLPPQVIEFLDDLGIHPDAEPLLIRRDVSQEGRSRGWLHGTTVPMSALAGVGEWLVDLHGQHETRSLVAPSVQRQLLDAYCRARKDALAVAEGAEKVEALRQDEHEVRVQSEEINRRSEYLRQLVQEIAAANPKVGEDEVLAGEARKLGQSDALLGLLHRLLEALEGEEGSALGALDEVRRALAGLERLDPIASDWSELHLAAQANLTELSRTAGEYLANFQHDPDRVSEVEQRRDVLFRLKQKHGGTLETVLAAQAEGKAELETLETSDERSRQLHEELEYAQDALKVQTAALSSKRRLGATRLRREAGAYLGELGFPEGSFRVELQPHEGAGGGRQGAESVSFQVQINSGLDPRPLNRVASGGELSRIMLAIKVALADHDETPTLVFDEIDQGVGGEVGGRVGQALARVAQNRQVLVITHLAPIAAQADRHLVVAKEDRAGVATSEVRRVEDDERVAELARMLGDPIADTARRHARALLGVQ